MKAIDSFLFCYFQARQLKAGKNFDELSSFA